MAGRRPHVVACVLLILTIWSSGAHPAESSACNVYALASCLAYSKSAQVPSRACCNSLASLGGGVVGSDCLCSLMTSQVAREYGVIPQYAIGMPNRCGIPVPWHETCNGSVHFWMYPPYIKPNPIVGTPFYDNIHKTTPS